MKKMRFPAFLLTLALLSMMTVMFMATGCVNVGVGATPTPPPATQSPGDPTPNPMSPPAPTPSPVDWDPNTAPVAKLVMDTSGMLEVAEGVYSMDDLLFITLETYPADYSVDNNEQSVVQRIETLLNTSIRVTTSTSSIEHSERLSYPVWMVVYDFGGNEDSAHGIDLFFSTDTNDYWVHTQTPVDWMQSYHDEIGRRLSTVMLVDEGYDPGNDPNFDPGCDPGDDPGNDPGDVPTKNPGGGDDPAADQYDWWGVYHNEADNKALSISSFRANPDGQYHFSFTLATMDGYELDGTAAVEGNLASYMDLEFEIDENSWYINVSQVESRADSADRAPFVDIYYQTDNG
ncbi:MAG: hypothetical protein FWE59_05845 [Oscillospiraceae bacterium]|nr:hypothetical protein [Oscillospiraceae bacterium]